MNTKNKKTIIVNNYFFTGLLSFVIPIFVLALSYFQLGIYPGGTNTVLIYDMREQLLPLYGYLSNGVNHGFNSFIHSMSGGLGGNFFGTVALYISPFDYIYRFIPIRYLPDAIYFMILTKVGLCGLCMSIFLKNNGIISLNNKSIITVSCCYALMSYNIMYSISPMWYDAVMFLPLIALSVEKIIKGKKSLAFILLMTFCIISDYYMAYMVSISLILYAAYRLVEEDLNRIDFLKRFCLFVIHGIMSAGLSAIVIIPVFLDFYRGKIYENNPNGNILKNHFIDIIKCFVPSHYSSFDYSAPPNVFCGTIILTFMLIWLFYGKKHIKARIVSGIIVFIYFLSFTLEPIDRIWHGFRNPIGFSERYAFTFVFFMCCFCLRGIESIQNSKIKSIDFVINIAVIYTFIELFFNCSNVLSGISIELGGYANRSEYERICDSILGILDIIEEDQEGYSRIVKDFNYSSIDGALFGYDGISRFSSSYNREISSFLSNVGVGSSLHILDDRGVTPPVASLLNIGYLICGWSLDVDCYADIGEYKGINIYKNTNLLPLIITTDLEDIEICNSFTDNPFENINIMYSDLFWKHLNDNSIFEEQEYESYYRTPDEYVQVATIGSADCIIEPDIDGNYWLYSKYVKPDKERFVNNFENDSAVSAYADYYLNGYRLGTYRESAYSFIDYIGYLEKNNIYDLTLDTSLSEVGDICLYWLNESVFTSLIEDINNNCFNVQNINKNGITATGSIENDSYVLITLPYEDGYSVYLDDQKVEYQSYRNVLMMVKVTAGDHVIQIKYHVPGMVVGFLISIMFLISLIMLFCIPQNKE